jgi:hypothetical protein
MITFLSRFLAVIFIAMTSAAATACPVCEQAQPRILRGIVHGPGPESRWDYGIAIAAVVITVLVLFYSVKWLISPGENEKTHIKHFILNPEVL